MTHATSRETNRHDTLTPVTGRSGRGTARQTIRVDEDLWGRFGAIAEPDRSTVLRDFIAWYVRESGAKMPQRPGPAGDLPPGIAAHVDDVTANRPAGRTWYRFATFAPMDAAALALVDQAGGQLSTDTGAREVSGRSLPAVRRAYDALRAAGYRIAEAD